MKSSVSLLVVGLALTISTRGAIGQEATVEGPGVKLGEGTVLHPMASLDGGYISNVFYQDNDPVGAGVLRLIGGFSIASQTDSSGAEQPDVALEAQADDSEELPTPPKLDFRLGGQLILMAYLSGNQKVRDQNNVAGAVDGHVVLFPEGDVALAAEDQFIRDARPQNFESSGNLDRDYNHAMASIMYQPGEHTIGVGLRYENVIDRFESSGAAFANRLQHLIGLRGEWRWLPYTKFYFDSSLGFFGPLSDSDSGGFKPTSNPLRVQLGIGTALSEITTLRAHVGYGNGFYSSRANFQNIIGGLEFGYRYAEYGRLSLLADYDFQDSLQANFFRDYMFRAQADQQLGLVLLSGGVDVRLRGYRGISPTLGAPSRDDAIFDANLGVNYLIRAQFALTARLQATIDSTDYMYSAGAVTATPQYQRYEAYLGATGAL